MKSVKIFSLTAAVLALFACSKAKQDAVAPAPANNNGTAIENESVPVPIELGSGTVTKAAMIDSAAFINTTKFRVLAIDTLAAATDPNKVLLNGVEAGNTIKQGKTYSETSFPNGPYYYPLNIWFSGWPNWGKNTNYTFFGYRTNENNSSALDENYNVTDIALGYSDLIWAKAKASTLPAPYAEYKGFNAKYIRAIKALAGGGDYLASSYAPKLHFNHITSALSFNIKAADEAAENSLRNKATLTGISLVNVKKTANLAVLDGLLSTTATADTLVVKTAAEAAPGAIEFVEAGAIFGAPLFILPTAIDNPYANNGDGYSVILSLNVNGQAMKLDPIKLTLPNDGFEAGKHYTFTISINSLEEIVIVTELTPWADGGSTEEIVIE